MGRVRARRTRHHQTAPAISIGKTTKVPEVRIGPVAQASVEAKNASAVCHSPSRAMPTASTAPRYCSAKTRMPCRLGMTMARVGPRMTSMARPRIAARPAAATSTSSRSAAAASGSRWPHANRRGRQGDRDHDPGQQVHHAGLARRPGQPLPGQLQVGRLRLAALAQGRDDVQERSYQGGQPQLGGSPDREEQGQRHPRPQPLPGGIPHPPHQGQAATEELGHADHQAGGQQTTAEPRQGRAWSSRCHGSHLSSPRPKSRVPIRTLDKAPPSKQFSGTKSGVRRGPAGRATASKADP